MLMHASYSLMQRRRRVDAGASKSRRFRRRPRGACPPTNCATIIVDSESFECFGTGGSDERKSDELRPCFPNEPIQPRTNEI